MTGMQALVRLLLEQKQLDSERGLKTCGLVSGYPGSPLGGFDIELNRHQDLLVKIKLRFNLPSMKSLQQRLSGDHNIYTYMTIQI